MPQEHKEDRAFGWPTGTVRAILAISLVLGLIGVIVLGLYLDGSNGAAQAGSVMGGPAGGGTAYYFANRGK